MAIIASSGEDPLPTGAVGGTVFRGQGGNSQVMVSKVSHANVQAREAFVIWGNLPKWRAIWATQSGAQQTSWNEFSQGNPDYGLQGAPRLKSGSEHFAAYWNRWEIMEGDEPEPPYDPPEPPVWTCPNPPFEEFLVNDPDFAMVLKSSSEVPTQIFTACRQPAMGRGTMARSTMQPLVTLDFADMLEGDEITTACDLAAAKYGTSAESVSAQQWFALWERVGGYARVLRDPCWTPGWEQFPETLYMQGKLTGGGTYNTSVQRQGQSFYWESGSQTAFIDEVITDGKRVGWTCAMEVEVGFGLESLEGNRGIPRFVQGYYVGEGGDTDWIVVTPYPPGAVI